MIKWSLLVIGILFNLMSILMNKDWQTAMIIGFMFIISGIIINEMHKTK